MVTMNSSTSSNGVSLDSILTSLQQGVVSINNLIQAMRAIFPSST